MPSAAYIWENGKAVVAAAWYLRTATEVGPRVRVYGTPSIQNGGRLIIGDRVRWYQGYRVPIAVDARIYAPYVASLGAILVKLGQSIFQEAPGKPSLVDRWHAALGATLGLYGRWRPGGAQR